jgi:hypothetical protein
VVEDEVDKSPRATAPPVIPLKITPRNSHKRILIQDQLRSNQISKQLAEQASEPEANSEGPLDEGSGLSGIVANAAVRSLMRQNPPRNSTNTVAAAAAAVAASAVEKGDEALAHFLIGHGEQREPEMEDEATSSTPGKQIMICLPGVNAVSAAAGGASAGADGGGAAVAERGGGAVGSGGEVGEGEGKEKKKGAAVKNGKNLWEERIQREKEEKEEKQREWDKIRNPQR